MIYGAISSAKVTIAIPKPTTAAMTKPTGESKAMKPDINDGSITSNGPSAAAIPAPITMNLLTSGLRFWKVASIFFRPSITGGKNSIMILPNSSCKSPNEFASCLSPPVPAFAAASADPPYCFSSSSSITVCASASRPLSVRLLMTCF